MVKTELTIQSDPSKKMLSTSTNSSPTTSSSLKKMKKYKGVRMRSWGSWVSEIRAPNQKTRIWLGSYSTPEAAARAYDAALLCLKGNSANFNFPITSSSHYIPSSDTIMSPKSIQRLAAAAAAGSFTVNNSPPAVSSPPPDSSSSSSISSSPSISDQIGSCYNTETISMTDSWFYFDDDQMFNTGALLFNPTPTPTPTPVVDDYYFDGDFRLWSFAD